MPKFYKLIPMQSDFDEERVEIMQGDECFLLRVYRLIEPGVLHGGSLDTRETLDDAVLAADTYKLPIHIILD